ncbi:TetR/AcrR family transcriptional regulator [Spirosoma sp. KNUC1025]|uniref:TetR/AcrR family transcriptional regulator n=1 Tax=Spirosoma sp. KNUC1025 TaxID=2894082 RepID=UPI00386FB273|nr:TetR/AcrR family transcriptional regulator [Spirosoma sp. KNUC1025]
MEKIKRNRADTTQRILNAFEQVLWESGLEGVSISTVAEKAEVSKVLIYRYFGSLEGLADCYIQQTPLITHHSPDQLAYFQLVQGQQRWSNQVLNLFRRFRRSRPARQLLKATVKSRESMTDQISETLDSELTRFVDQLNPISQNDNSAISAILLGGLSYLTLQAQVDRSVIGMDLRSDQGWKRIEEAIKLICASLDNPLLKLTQPQKESAFLAHV